ncbi:hypothetical protein RB614_32350 [Phytohabitans sp. ZYX-F-186]|uniref:CBM6 domain-containing protein n=1 Tax=Phytohabitans maris TaxID=3071409 RepID=A0ABU0ZQB0_9ACTN|nr:hypothetical protein [Phytohabitans sp. ZYX-F-186]MDQ7909224.1 hypothetical protein [Phytohabitans sp. ZYX-F-186]
MTTADRKGMDRLRVGGWLPPPRGTDQRGMARLALPAAPSPTAPARRGAHAVPDDEEPEHLRPPTPYAAPPFDLDAPVSAPVPPPSGADPGAAATAGRYVRLGRRGLREIAAPGPHRQRIRLGLAGVAVLALAIVAVATLSPDGEKSPDAGRGLALPTGPPRAPAPSADQEIGPAEASPTPSRAKAAPASSDAGPFTRTYEAEDAALIGGAEVLSLRQAGGGRIVQGIGTGSDRRPGLVSFTEVEVPATNRYALTVDYVSGEDRTAILTINSETHLRLSFPSSGDWDVVGSRTFTIVLVGGRNNLTFSNPDGWAPRLDRISLLG